MAVPLLLGIPRIPPSQTTPGQSIERDIYVRRIIMSWLLGQKHRILEFADDAMFTLLHHLDDRFLCNIASVETLSMALNSTSRDSALSNLVVQESAWIACDPEADSHI